ncbi:MAG TPA: hypothetical protein VFW85_09385 [Gaiellaceae bacterium]|nr:hypothetical protein [Gaiellaceae bacterium]
MNDIIDFDDLDANERERLERVHALLLQAGPPPELSPSLTKPGAPPEPARILHLQPRRQRVLLLAAATVAAVAFGGGYLAGHPSTFTAERVVDMHATGGGNALAVLKIAERDAVGNWPMRISVSGLPQQAQRTAYYELWLTRKGQPSESCGTFRVHGKTTTVDLSVPYSFKGISGWVVTAHTPGETEPGDVVLTT